MDATLSGRVTCLVGADAGWLKSLRGVGMMQRFVWKYVGVAVAVIVASGFLGVGLASGSPPFYGQKYGDASAELTSRGQKAAIATIIGSQLATDDCIVTNAYTSLTLDSSGRPAHRQTYMFDINCNAAFAQPGKPGNSVASPEGKQAKALDDRAVELSKNYDTALANGLPPWCDSHADFCKKVYDNSGMCSDELVKYLAKF